MTTHNSVHAHAPAGATQLSNCETVELRDVELRGTTVPPSSLNYVFCNPKIPCCYYKSLYFIRMSVHFSGLGHVCLLNIKFDTIVYISLVVSGLILISRLWHLRCGIVIHEIRIAWTFDEIQVKIISVFVLWITSHYCIYISCLLYVVCFVSVVHNT
jgi:hypothetical protein